MRNSGTHVWQLSCLLTWILHCYSLKHWYIHTVYAQQHLLEIPAPPRDTSYSFFPSHCLPLRAPPSFLLSFFSQSWFSPFLLLVCPTYITYCEVHAPISSSATIVPTYGLLNPIIRAAPYAIVAWPYGLNLLIYLYGKHHYPHMVV